MRPHIFHPSRLRRRHLPRLRRPWLQRTRAAAHAGRAAAAPRSVVGDAGGWRAGERHRERLVAFHTADLVAVDVAITHPLSYKRVMDGTTDDALREREQSKRSKYAGRYTDDGQIFVPLVYSTYGKLAQDGEQLFTTVIEEAYAGETEDMRGWIKHKWQRRLSFTLLKGVANTLLAGNRHLATSLTKDGFTLPPLDS